MRWFHRDRLHRAYHPDVPRPSSVLLHSRVVIVAVLGAAVALSVAALGAHDAMLAVDEPVSEWVRGQAWLGQLRFADQFGSEADGMVIAVVTGLFLWRWCHRFAVVVPLAVAFGIAVNVALKVLTDRPRPPDPDASVALASFPSGHALHAVIVFGLLPPVVYILTGRRSLFWAATAVGGLVVVAVAAMRVHLGAHWPSDVAASALIGASILLLAEYAVASPTPAHRRCCPLHRSDPAPALGGVPTPPSGGVDPAGEPPVGEGAPVVEAGR